MWKLALTRTPNPIQPTWRVPDPNRSTRRCVNTVWWTSPVALPPLPPSPGNGEPVPPKPPMHHNVTCVSFEIAKNTCERCWYMKSMHLCLGKYHILQHLLWMLCSHAQQTRSLQFSLNCAVSSSTWRDVWMTKTVVTQSSLQRAQTEDDAVVCCQKPQNCGIRTSLIITV